MQTDLTCASKIEAAYYSCKLFPNVCKDVCSACGSAAAMASCERSAGSPRGLIQLRKKSSLACDCD